MCIRDSNAGKLDEIRALLADFPVEIVGAADLNLPEPDETEDTFVGNARIKAHAAARATGLPALADDSGIEIADLDGAPGVYTADWAETPNRRDFRMAMEKAHDQLLASDAAQPWNARFCCTLVMAWPNGSDQVFEGIAEGQFVWPMRGAEGHGYDPIFQPVGHTKTFAELSADAKNQISHRADAFDKLIRGLFE